MNPSTSRTATGSLRPDSPSSVRASRRPSVEPRSSAKIAALSVDDRIPPSSRPSSVVRSSSHEAVSPATTAVTTVPTTARLAPRAAPAGSRGGPMSGLPRTGSARARRCRRCARARSRRNRPSRSVGADGHPETEEQDEPRNTHTGRRSDASSAGREQRARNEDQLPSCTAATMPGGLGFAPCAHCPFSQACPRGRGGPPRYMIRCAT